MDKKNPWILANKRERDAIESFSKDYKNFLNECKTERESVDYALKIAKKNNFKNAKDVKKLKAGDKVYYTLRDKNIAFVVIGKDDIERGINFVVSHIDSPRLDLKPKPLVEENELALLKTHYYGGVKKYQWLSRELALHGKVILSDGTKINLNIGESEDDPVFVIPDILPHLDRKIQRDKKSDEIIEGENLKVLIGSLPVEDEKAKKRVKDAILKILKEKHKIQEEDFISAEIEVVPAGKARDVGLDKSLIGSYGQDDRICAYTSLKALLEIKGSPKKTAICFWTDKEEIGSTGSTGLQSKYIEYFVSDIIFKTKKDSSNTHMKTQETFWNSKSISADVCAGINPLFPSVHDFNNAPKIGWGIAIVKYTGSAGKSSANDADAELIAHFRKIFNENKVAWQTAILGKVEEGGAGTVAKYLAHYGIQTVDIGPAVLSMHSPFEITSKTDLYHSFKAYKVFFEN